MLENFISFDGDLLVAIQNIFSAKWVQDIAIFITHLGDGGAVWIALSLLFLVFKKTRPVGLAMAIALVGSFVINNIILKPLVARTRPYEVIDAVHLLVEKENDYSFPSGHSGSSIAAGLAAYLMCTRLYAINWFERHSSLFRAFGMALLVLAVLISFSRLIVGVHYPSDVAVGMITGSICGIVSEKLVMRKYPLRKNH